MINAYSLVEISDGKTNLFDITIKLVRLFETCLHKTNVEVRTVNICLLNSLVRMLCKK
jgi:hypothetical protein